jgi:hypothetical protein
MTGPTRLDERQRYGPLAARNNTGIRTLVTAAMLAAAGGAAAARRQTHGAYTESTASSAILREGPAPSPSGPTVNRRAAPEPRGVRLYETRVSETSADDTSTSAAASSSPGEMPASSASITGTTVTGEVWRSQNVPPPATKNRRNSAGSGDALCGSGSRQSSGRVFRGGWNLLSS